MNEETTLETVLQHFPKLTILGTMLSGFILLIITGIYGPKFLIFTNGIATKGLSGMHWQDFLTMVITLCFVIFYFCFLFGYKMLEKFVITGLLTSKIIPKKGKF